MQRRWEGACASFGWGALCIPAVPPSPRDKKVAEGGREGDHVIEQSLSCIVNNDASGMIDCPNAHKMSARCLLKIDDVRAAFCGRRWK